MVITRKLSTQQCVTMIFLCFILIFAFTKRITPMFTWEITPDKFIVDQNPILTNSDGYFYLSIAKEIQEGTYSTVDKKRAFPEGVPRNSTPPLISVLIAFVSTITHTSIIWIGTYIPAVLAMLLALPLFLFGYRWGGPTMALPAVLIGLFAPVFTYRTGLGFLDTDCMNVTFSLICAYLFMRFATEKSKKRYLFLVISLFNYILFLWWWDQSPAAVTALSLSPLLIALLFFYRPSKKEGLVFIGSSCLAITIVLFYSGWQQPLNLWHAIIGLFSYISKEEVGFYPNIGRFITEQYATSFQYLVKGTATNIIVFGIAIVGFFMLVLKEKKEFLFIVPVLAVGVLSYHALRFLIFLVPLVSLGFGYFLFFIYTISNKNKIILSTFVPIMLFICWQAYQNAYAREIHFSGQTIIGMKKLDKITPSDAVIWSWWNGGHPLVYWANRATINDGMMHGGRRTHYNALPMSTSNPRLAANFMQFYAVRGIAGINKFTRAVNNNKINTSHLLAEILSHEPKKAAEFIAKIPMKNCNDQPKDWLEFFFPASPPPLYLFLDVDTLKQTQPIFWFGSWNTTSKTGTKTLPPLYFPYVPFDDMGQPVSGSVTIDTQRGVMGIPGMFKTPIPLQHTIYTNHNNTYSVSYDNQIASPITTELYRKANPLDFLLSQQGYYCLNLHIPAGNGMLQDCQQTNTIINRLFWQKDNNDSKYFRLVDQHLPYFQIWEVKGDRI